MSGYQHHDLCLPCRLLRSVVTKLSCLESRLFRLLYYLVSIVSYSYRLLAFSPCIDVLIAVKTVFVTPHAAALLSMNAGSPQYTAR